MKTYKIFLKDYGTETINAENFAVDDQNNLVVGNNLFHREDWKRVIFLYDNAVEHGYVNPYYGDLQQGYVGQTASSYSETAQDAYPVSSNEYPY